MMYATRGSEKLVAGLARVHSMLQLSKLVQPADSLVTIGVNPAPRRPGAVQRARAAAACTRLGDPSTGLGGLGTGLGGLGAAGVGPGGLTARTPPLSRAPGPARGRVLDVHDGRWKTWHMRFWMNGCVIVLAEGQPQVSTWAGEHRSRWVSKRGWQRGTNTRAAKVFVPL